MDPKMDLYMNWILITSMNIRPVLHDLIHLEGLLLVPGVLHG